MQIYVHRALYQVLERAFDGSGMPWRDCAHEDRGDGVLVVTPPGMPVAGLVDPLPERLRGLTRLHNRVSNEDARIQLRTAAHVGNVHLDGHGFVGDAVNHLFRLLNAPRFKQLLAAADAELALITSDHVFATIVRRHPTLVDPAAFRPVMVEVTQTMAKAWVYIPGFTGLAAGNLRLGRPA